MSLSKCHSLSLEDDLVNPHNIVSCIEFGTLQGIESNMFSPTEMYIMSFVPGTNFQGTPLEKGFLKVFIANDTGIFREKFEKELRGSKYELEVYKKVKELLVKNVNCHFVKVLGGVAGGISFEKIASFIATYSSVPHTNILNNMVRNLGFKKSHDIKPSITNNKELPGQLPYDKVKKYMDRIEFGFILTQGLTSVDFPLAFLNDNDFYENYKFYHNLPVNKTMKLRDLFNLNNIFQFILYKKSINRIIPNKDDLQTEIRILGMCIKGLFQCATACYALYINGVAHNDLHADNVMMQKTEPTVFRYIFADVRPDIALEYRVVSRYCALIYDWDRAFYVDKGNNPLLEEEYLALANQSNELIEQRDFLKIFCYFYKTLKVDNKIINQYFTDELLSCICKPKPEGVIFDPINYVTEKKSGWWKDYYRKSIGPFGLHDKDMYKDFWDQIFSDDSIGPCFLTSKFIQKIHPDIYKETLYTLPEIIDNLYNLKDPSGNYYVTRDFDPRVVKTQKTSVIRKI